MLSTNIGFFSKTLLTVYASYKYQTYFGLVVYAVVALLICSLLASIAYLLSLSSSQDSEKKSEYECGFEPFDSATRLPFDVHFYLVGILFLIFDVEIALLFPWVLSLNTCGWFGFYLMISFIILLSVGFLYEWKRGALIWPSRQKENAYKAFFFLFEINEHFPINNYEMPAYWIHELKESSISITDQAEQKLIAYLPETTLVAILLYIVASIALELDKKHVKKFLALESLKAFQIGTLFILVLLYINMYFDLINVSENGYSVENLYITTLKILLTITVLFVLSNSTNYIKNHQKDLLEFPIILGLSFFFMLLLTGTQHLVSAFLCIVGFSLNLYVLILFDAPEAVAREAGIKYYYLSTFSSGLILYGTFLMFLTTKTLNFSEINQVLTCLVQGECNKITSISLLLILLGIFFKLSAFPGHLWASEVYEGSSNVVTSFFMLPVKIAVLAFLMQFITLAVEPLRAVWQPIMVFAAISSMLWGCFAAVFEKKTKRFLAYTSINQIGFLFIGLAVGSIEGYRATIVYLMIYTVMNIGFLTIFLNSTLQKKKTLTYLTDFRGLGLENWLWGWSLAITMFSMAGIPPLAGFFGKFYLILHAQEQKLYLLVIVALVTSLVSAYYYLRMIKIIWFENYTNVKNVTCKFNTMQESLLYATQAILFSFIIVAFYVLEQIDVTIVRMFYGTYKDCFYNIHFISVPRDLLLEYCLPRHFSIEEEEFLYGSSAWKERNRIATEAGYGNADWDWYDPFGLWPVEPHWSDRYR